MMSIGQSSVGATLLRDMRLRARRDLQLSAGNIELVAEHSRDKRYWQKYTIYINTGSPLSDAVKEVCRQAAIETRGARDDCRLVLHDGNPNSPLYEETFT